MKRITKEMLGLPGCRHGFYGNWTAHADAGSRLCFDNSNPLGTFRNLASWNARNKIYSEINLIVFDKTNNQNITESHEKIKN